MVTCLCSRDRHSCHSTAATPAACCLLPALPRTSPRWWPLFPPRRPRLPPPLRPPEPPQRFRPGALARRGPDPRPPPPPSRLRVRCGLPRGSGRSKAALRLVHRGHLPKGGDPAASPEPPGARCRPPAQALRPLRCRGPGVPGSRFLSFRACTGLGTCRASPAGAGNPTGGQRRAGGWRKGMRSPGWARV